MYVLLKMKIFQPAMLVYQKISFTLPGNDQITYPLLALTFEVDDDFPAETRLVGYVSFLSQKGTKVPNCWVFLHRPRMPELMANAFQKLGFERVGWWLE